MVSSAGHETATSAALDGSVTPLHYAAAADANMTVRVLSRSMLKMRRGTERTAIRARNGSQLAAMPFATAMQSVKSAKSAIFAGTTCPKPAAVGAAAQMPGQCYDCMTKR